MAKQLKEQDDDLQNYDEALLAGMRVPSNG
jgi:hypothetical protein